MKPQRSAFRRVMQWIVACGLTLGLVGCGGHYPADPGDSLNRISGGTLRVGISHQPPWTDISSGETDPEGIEVQLIEDYAATINAEVEWQAGGEEELMTLLSGNELDLVIGGLTSQSPWSSDAGLTTSFAESIGVDGSTTQHVMAVQMGENAFMTSLERFLLDQNIEQQVPEEMRP
ncbi:transporter substrate-binding domain-containing protein [Yaniella flava]